MKRHVNCYLFSFNLHMKCWPVKHSMNQQQIGRTAGTSDDKTHKKKLWNQWVKNTEWMSEFIFNTHNSGLWYSCIWWNNGIIWISNDSFHRTQLFQISWWIIVSLCLYLLFLCLMRMQKLCYAQFRFQLSTLLFPANS